MDDASGRFEPRLFGDDPIDGVSQPDLLHRGDFAVHVVGLLDRVRAQSNSSVLAVIGPWGSGKSSVLQMTLRLLEQKDASAYQWLVAEFNPWNYADLDSLQAGFFTELRAALPSGRKWGEARKRLGDFGKAISPLGAIASLVGLDVSGIMVAAAKAVGGDGGVTATKRAAESALAALDRPILMILDDLDRLTPDELLRVLKLVRLVGRLPNVYYVLCYDERTLLDVLARTELVAESDERRARDYLEKIVQVRLDLPTLRGAQAAKLFDDAYESVLSRNGVTLSEGDEYRLNSAYWECLHRYLATPRSISRFVAQIDAFYGLVQGEVDFIDYTIVTWLRATQPGLFAMLREHRAELTMTDMRRALRQRQQAPRDELPEWRNRLRAAGVVDEQVEEFLKLLGSLFLPIRSALENMTHSNSAMVDIGARRGVGHVDYFDRYFTFGIPDDDMPDADIVSALQLIATRKQGPARDRLLLALVGDTDRVCVGSAAQYGVPRGGLDRERLA